MLTWILDHCLGVRYRYYDLCTQVSALAEGEDVRLRCAWRFIIHPHTAWNPAVRARVHAAILGDEMVSVRAGFLW